MLHKLKTISVLGVLVALCVGCGNSQAKLTNDLKATGLAYISFNDDNKKPPADWDELITYAEKSSLFPEGIRRVRDAKYVVTWGAKVGQGSASSTVLAKPPGAGPTLYLDGSVR